MNKKRKEIISSNEISELVQVSLGGHEQKILIEGKTGELPVVITLHGGPGSPIPFGIGCRGMFPDFTNQFIMVYWDQYGCGANDAKIGDEFCIDDFVNMTVDLVNYMKERFPGNKLILFGISWGSILCMRTVSRMNGQIDAAVTWGQIIKEPMCNQAVLEVLQEKLPENDQKRLKEIWEQPVTNDKVMFIAKCIQKYTDGYFNKTGKQIPMGSMVWQIFTSPDYRMKDFKAVAVNGTTKNKSLWPELCSIDMTDIMKNIEIPYIILQGETDIVTNTKMIEQLTAQSGNANLRCRVVNDNGHIPNASGMDAAIEELLCLR